VGVCGPTSSSTTPLRIRRAAARRVREVRRGTWTPSTPTRPIALRASGHRGRRGRGRRPAPARGSRPAAARLQVPALAALIRAPRGPPAPPPAPRGSPTSRSSRSSERCWSCCRAATVRSAALDIPELGADRRIVAVARVATALDSGRLRGGPDGAATVSPTGQRRPAHRSAGRAPVHRPGRGQVSRSFRARSFPSPCFPSP